MQDNLVALGDRMEDCLDVHGGTHRPHPALVLLDAEAWREQFVDDVVVLLAPLLVLPTTSQLFVLNLRPRAPPRLSDTTYRPGGFVLGGLRAATRTAVLFGGGALI